MYGSVSSMGWGRQHLNTTVPDPVFFVSNIYTFQMNPPGFHKTLIYRDGSGSFGVKSSRGGWTSVGIAYTLMRQGIRRPDLSSHRSH
jgi:hypothetical protein